MDRQPRYLKRHAAQPGGQKMRRQGHVTRLAIPGQPTRYSAPPHIRIDRALERVADLSRRLGCRSLLACTRSDPIRVAWAAPPPAEIARCVVAPHGKLYTMIDDFSAWGRGIYSARSITWEWGVIREYADGWHDDGWHPCAVYFGLSAPWRAMFDDALERHPS